MALFDTVKVKYQQFEFNNIYNSAAFFKTAYNQVLTRGVTRKGMRGIPPYVDQKGLDLKKANIETRGTENESVMEGGIKCHNLIEASMHYTNHVHCISMVSEELKWFVK